MVCAPVRSIIPELKLGDYLSVQAHKPCSISHLYHMKLQCHFLAVFSKQFNQWTFSMYRVGCIILHWKDTCPEVIKRISCSTQLSMYCFLLINTVGILAFMSRENSILGLSEPL